MSGIFGIHYFNNRVVKPKVLQQMSDILAHRGSDGADIWHQTQTGLGHRLLWTTPESLLEKQPLADDERDCIITADARIDNREELISKLGLNKFLAEKITDIELILKAYYKWGEKCPQKLLGDFAFAIWDKSKQQFFCARDHFGVKPFYYYYSAGDTFVFASEIKAILCSPEVPQKLNQTRIGDYLTSMFEDREITFYQNILRLPPAHSLTVSNKRIELKSYWSLDPNKELLLDSDEEYAAQFREIFTEAVRCRLRSHTQAGTMLSGGLDSSSITCIARQIMNEENVNAKLPTFSAIFDEVKECDERKYINTVLNRGKYEPYYIHADQISPLTSNSKCMLWHHDEPVYAPNLFLNMSLYKIAQRQSIRVILDGFDGDSTVSHGTGYLRDLARKGKWIALFHELKGYAHNFNFPFWKTQRAYIMNYGINPFVEKSQLLKLGRRFIRGLIRRIKSVSKQPVVSWRTSLNSDFVKQTDLEQRRQAQRKFLLESQAHQRAEHYYSLVRGVMPYTLEVLDKAAAAYDIELRFPFWDKRLVEFCLSLPPEQKIRRGWTRMIMRQGLKGVLPPEIEWRGGKSNLGSNFSYGLFTFERQLIKSVLFQNSSRISNYINLTSLKAAYQKFIMRQANGEEEMDIWRALTLSLWLEHRNQAIDASKHKSGI
ncbi:MAG: lasso peptide isopeptide bond-forming cyclase [Cyanobacteria bacterium J06621_8]